VSGVCSLVSTRGPLSPRCHSLLELHSPQSLFALITVHCIQLFPFPITNVMFCVYKYPACLVFVTESLLFEYVLALNKDTAFGSSASCVWNRDSVADVEYLLLFCFRGNVAVVIIHSVAMSCAS